MWGYSALQIEVTYLHNSTLISHNRKGGLSTVNETTFLGYLSAIRLVFDNQARNEFYDD